MADFPKPRAFDTAYPGSMSEKPHGDYIFREDVHSLAAALVERIHELERKVEDLNEMVHQPLVKSAPELLAAVEEALEFAEGYEDVVDGSYGEPRPNRAMSVAQTLRAAIAKATGSEA